MYIELSFWAYQKFTPHSSHHPFTPLFHAIKVHISMVCGIGSVNIYFSILKLKKNNFFNLTKFSFIVSIDLSSPSHYMKIRKWGLYLPNLVYGLGFLGYLDSNCELISCKFQLKLCITSMHLAHKNMWG